MLIAIRISQIAIGAIGALAFGWRGLILVLVSMFIGGLAIVEDQINESPRRNRTRKSY